MARTIPTLPIPARRALKKLGRDIKDARRRRRIPAAVVADRARISPRTLVKVEKGDAAVSMGIYAAVLFALGLIHRLSDLADAGKDLVGRRLEEEKLPKRIRL
jgi:transcriptional regulator with XRE-family HTH domain